MSFRPTARLLAASATALGLLALANHVVARRSEARRPPRGRFVQVDGLRLHVIEHGTDRPGPPVVLLHGNGAMAEDFALSGIVGSLARHHHVLVFDRPGFGHSDRPRRRIWTAAAQARLIGRALHRLGVDRAVLAGHSWGTLVAMEMALQRPDQVAALVLMSGYYTPTLRAEVPAFSGPAIPILGDLLRYTLSPLLGLAIAPLLFRRIFAPGPVPAHFAAGFPTGLALRPSQLRAAAADTALMVPAAMATRHRHGALPMPVLILAGDGDRIVDVERQSGRLHRDIPGSTLRLLPGAGHMIHHQAPDAVVRAIRDAAARATA
ncbi:alpha/beta fold hydrolase [Falsiroseomonas selenitidurans]|uniref:Alpha/beta hydrolase n=1 Tax=Falsiroseomonas selenitidurans TaxID=2716335 RepID=A0ABX1E916_9PROT|nr:alpha/beta hydrolase [Falsiroseomonas selenitidurans]NKC32262.1 alpha/beta hydrolase [Falsiroseomonas selenitidurans]